MPRLPEIDATTTLSRTARDLRPADARARPYARALRVWLRNAELCENTLKLQEMFASRVKLERRLLELMILVAARSVHRTVCLVHP